MGEDKKSMNTQHLTSLELSKQLKEAGIEQKSEFYWVKELYSKTEKWELYSLGWMQDTIETDNGDYDNVPDLEKRMLDGTIVSAFLASELGEMLPEDVYIPYKGNSGKRRKYPQHPHIFKHWGGKKWMINYTGGNSQERLGESADTLSGAMGQMLLYLKQHNLLEEEI